MCIAHSTFTLGPLQQPCPSFFEYQYKTPDFMPNIVCSASFNRLLFVFSGISLYWSTARIERAVTTYITTGLLYHSYYKRIANVAACPSLSHKFNLVPIYPLFDPAETLTSPL